jgi:hypothetical protein
MVPLDATIAKRLTKMLSTLEQMCRSADKMLRSANQVEDVAIDLEETMSQVELSRSINISTFTIIKWRRLGLIPFEKCGVRYFYNRSAVIKALKLRSSKFDYLFY